MLRSRLAPLLLAAALPAQAEPAAPIHPYLADRLAGAPAGEHLPVYFVLADRLGRDHWFPRVRGLPVEERRALVMAELRRHAARTQAPLLEHLRRLEARGAVSHIVPNWLGNFVACRATAAAVVAVAGRVRSDLAEVRYDAAWPVELVRDAATPAAGAAPAGVPTNGPLHTRADEVWALGFEGQGVVVMNADSGINVQHGDLRRRLWTNPGEIPGNGIDDDGNGYVDDVHGWNFFDDDNEIGDSGGHGTQTAGTLVGDGSCSGYVTGQAPAAQVMTAALGPPTPQSGPFTPAGEVAQWHAIQYAIQMGAHVQTSSYSYKNSFVPPPNYAMHREVGDNSLAAGLIRTNSTGNNGAKANSSTSLDRIPFNFSTPGNLPPPYLDPNQILVGRRGGVIGVGAHDVDSGVLTSYSPRGPYAWSLADLLEVNPSYPPAHWNPSHDDYPWSGGRLQGLLKPDVTGPTDTTTTRGAGRVCSLGPQGGTSNATPRVAGSMVLWKSANPSLGPEDMAMIVHRTATPSGSVPGKENDWGAGRVDAFGGALLARCVNRVNGDPAWSVAHRAGTSISLEVDTVRDALTVLLIGTRRLAVRPGSGAPGLGGNVAVGFFGRSGASGDVRVPAFVPAGAAGVTVYTQWLTDDFETGRLLSSNVIGIRVF